MDGAKPILKSKTHQRLVPTTRTKDKGKGKARGLTVRLQDPQNLVPRNEPDLRHPMRVPQDDANLGRRQSSSSELDDLLGDVFRGGFGPGGLGAAVGEGGGGCDSE